MLDKTTNITLLNKINKHEKASIYIYSYKYNIILQNLSNIYYFKHVNMPRILTEFLLRKNVIPKFHV